MDKMVVLPRSGKFRTGVFAREHFSGWLLVSKGSSGPLVGTPVEVGEGKKKRKKESLLGNGAASEPSWMELDANEES